MLLNILRAVFILLMAAVGYASLTRHPSFLFIALALGIIFVFIDVLAPRNRKLVLFSGTFFGLIVGRALYEGTVDLAEAVAAVR